MEYLIGLVVILVIIIGYLLYKNRIAKKEAIEEIFNFFLLNAYEERVKWFRTLNKYVKGRPSVFVGDSITQEFLLSEIYAGLNVCNRGIGGDTTEGVLKRMNESIFDVNPSQLFLMIGTNDLVLSDLSSIQIVENIKKICVQSLEKLPDLKIHVVSIFPVSEQKDPKVDPNTVGDRTNITINEINKMLEEYAKEVGINYLDISSLLIDETGNLNVLYTREGLHLSQTGYEKIESIYRKHL